MIEPNKIFALFFTTCCALAPKALAEEPSQSSELADRVTHDRGDASADDSPLGAATACTSNKWICDDLGYEGVSNGSWWAWDCRIWPSQCPDPRWPIALFPYPPQF